MTPKKLHEVEKLASFVSTTVAADEILKGTTYGSCGGGGGGDGLPPREVVLVDIGSGQGYLSRVLAVKHNFRVVAVELDEHNIRRARDVDQRVAGRSLLVFSRSRLVFSMSLLVFSRSLLLVSACQRR
jgi:2-polyprenyl-3-methyl-5-hydroxy-6-metoxy-1,4-benzoquinol methylase